MAKMKRGMGDATRCVHAGEAPSGPHKPITTEIVQTSVFVLDGLEDLRLAAEGKANPYMYTRYANPTTAAAEEKIAALEGAEACVVTASGMAATMAAVLSVCSGGDEIVSMLDVYGGTIKMLDQEMARFGLKVKYVPFAELDRIERHFSRNTKMFFLETPTNPTLRCVDIERLAGAAKKRGICTVVDNTFATPILQKPLALGADLSLHSATKYLGGHSDVTAGALAGAKKWIDPARRAMKNSGGCLDPGASYLLIRGLKTLEIRVERACKNAAEIVEALQRHPKVQRVLFPGLGDNEGHEFAKKQMSNFGMMVSFEIRGGTKQADKFIRACDIWALATSLGGVESTISYPLLSSHVGLDSKRLKLMDVGAATIRLSVGIENSADLVADLVQALDRI